MWNPFFLKAIYLILINRLSIRKMNKWTLFILGIYTHLFSIQSYIHGLVSVGLHQLYTLQTDKQTIKIPLTYKSSHPQRRELKIYVNDKGLSKN